MQFFVIYTIGFGILIWMGIHHYKEFKKAEPKEKKQLGLIYICVLIVSALLIIGLQMTNIPQKVFPNYYERKTADVEAQKRAETGELDPNLDNMLKEFQEYGQEK